MIDVPEWDDPGFVVAPLPDQSWHAGAAQMVDNFLDLAHFPFTHTGTFGDPDDIEVPTYTVERDGLGFTCDYVHSTKRLADSMGAEEFAVADRRSIWFYAAPFAIRLRHRVPADDVVMTILFFHQPVDATTTSCTARPAQRHRRRPHHLRGRAFQPRSPRRTERCSNAWSARPSRSTATPRCTPGPTGSPSRCAGSCPTSLPHVAQISAGSHAGERLQRRSGDARSPLAAVGAGIADRAVDHRWTGRGADGMIVTPAEAIEPIVSTIPQTSTAGPRRRRLVGRPRACSSAGALAIVAALAVPCRRCGAISRFAAIANAAPWVAVAPCLLVVLGRDRGPTAVAALAAFFSVSRRPWASPPPRGADDVVAALGAPGAPFVGPSSCRRLALAHGRAQASRHRLPWRAPCSASGTAPTGASVYCCRGDAGRSPRTAVGGIVDQAGRGLRGVRAFGGLACRCPSRDVGAGRSRSTTRRAVSASPRTGACELGR